MKLSKQSIIAIVVISIIFLITLYAISKRTFYQPVQVVVEAKIESPDTFQLFYDTGKGFNEGESIRKYVSRINTLRTIKFNLPLPPMVVLNFRLDTGDINNTVEIKQISLKTVKQTFSWGPQEILNEFSGNNHFSLEEVQGNVLYLETSGGDPQLVFYGSISNKVDADDVNNKGRKTMYFVLTIGIFLLAILAVPFCIKKYSHKK